MPINCRTADIAPRRTVPTARAVDEFRIGDNRHMTVVPTLTAKPAITQVTDNAIGRGVLAASARFAPGQFGQHPVVGRQIRIVVAVGGAVEPLGGALVGAPPLDK